jgi:hypothetical protein
LDKGKLGVRIDRSKVSSIRIAARFYVSVVGLIPRDLLRSRNVILRVGAEAARLRTGAEEFRSGGIIERWCRLERTAEVPASLPSASM